MGGLEIVHMNLNWGWIMITVSIVEIIVATS